MKNILSKDPRNPHCDTLWSPNILQSVDYQSFKKLPEERSDVIAAKWRHKKFMEKRGTDFNKFLNTPEHRLPSSIIIYT